MTFRSFKRLHATTECAKLLARLHAIAGTVECGQTAASFTALEGALAILMVEPKSEEEQYNKWKLLIPYLYDWFANHNLTWPSLSCRYAVVLHMNKACFVGKMEVLVFHPFSLLQTGVELQLGSSGRAAHFQAQTTTVFVRASACIPYCLIYLRRIWQKWLR